MIWAAREIFVPLNYLRIRHGRGLFHSKRVYDVVLPTAFALITVIIFLSLGVSLSVFDHDDLVKRILDLLALMIVFYMAALAAVANFERKGIDELLRGGDAILWVRRANGGTKIEKKLSYRQFISYIFGFLSFLSLLLYISIVILSFMWPPIRDTFCQSQIYCWVFSKIIDPVLLYVVSFLIWELTFTSLLGIYFLTERIQTLNDPDP